MGNLKGLREAITNEKIVWFSDHVSDNSFIYPDAKSTLENMENRGYEPCGVCYEPNYQPSSGVALVFFDTEFDTTAWVHIPHSWFIKWCEQLGVDWQKIPLFARQLA